MSHALLPSASPPRSRLVVGLCVVALALGGCVSVLPQAKPVQLYRFGQDAPPPNAAGGTVLVRGEGVAGVVLLTPSLPRAAVGDGILTLDGDKAAYIAGARWLSPAALMFQEDAQAAFEARARRTRLLDRGQLGVATALLRLDVSHFEVRYDQGAASVLVSIRATLTSADGRVAVQQAFTHDAPVAENRVAPLVAGFDRATDAALADVVAWTDANAPTLIPAAPASVTTTRTSTSTTAAGTP